MRKHGRVDQNQRAIVAALRKIGVSVAVTSSLGDGFPDLVCYKNGQLRLVELKLPGEKLTDDQVRFQCSFPVHIAHSVEEALDLFLLKRTFV